MLHVDAVQDAGELVIVVRNDALQTVGVKGVLQFLGVGGGDGGDIIGGVDGALDQVHVPVVGEHIFSEIALIQPQHVPQDIPVELSLVLDVVDGEHAPGVH